MSLVRPGRAHKAEEKKAETQAARDNVTVAKRVGAVFLSLSLIFHGGYNMINNDVNAALADFAGAYGIAGLPRFWFRGWKIVFPDPEPLSSDGPKVLAAPTSCVSMPDESLAAIRELPTTSFWVPDPDPRPWTAPPPAPGPDPQFAERVAEYVATLQVDCGGLDTTSG